MAFKNDKSVAPDKGIRSVPALTWRHSIELDGVSIWNRYFEIAWKQLRFGSASWIRVVGLQIEGTIQKWRFCIFVIVLWRCGRGRGAKASKNLQNVMIFMIFDDFSQKLIVPGRGSVKRYGHIYFLDRSRCDLFESSRISYGLGTFWLKNWKLRLQARPKGRGQN